MRPTLGENIGAAARAMMNFGLSEMRLVEPKGDWPNQKAINTASGAERILEEAKIHHTTGAAVATYSVFTRQRRACGTWKSPFLHRVPSRTRCTGTALRGEIRHTVRARGQRLHNDDVAISDAIIMVPVNSEHRSINLAQAVLLIGYEWFQQTRRKRWTK